MMKFGSSYLQRSFPAIRGLHEMFRAARNRQNHFEDGNKAPGNSKAYDLYFMFSANHCLTQDFLLTKPQECFIFTVLGLTRDTLFN